MCLTKDTLQIGRRKYSQLIGSNIRIQLITNYIKDLNNEEIQGSFCEHELLRAKQDIFRIEKVIKKDYKKNKLW